MAGMILRKTGVVLLTILHGIKVVSAPACTGRKSGTIPGRCVCR